MKLIVIQDQDSNDCIKLKQSLKELIKANNEHLPFLIRIACKELENWYLVDMQMIEKACPNFKAIKHQNKTKYRNNPDNIFGAAEVDKLVKGFSKGAGSRTIPLYMILETNNSASFQQLISGIQKFLKGEGTVSENDE